MKKGHDTSKCRWLKLVLYAKCGIKFSLHCENYSSWLTRYKCKWVVIGLNWSQMLTNWYRFVLIGPYLSLLVQLSPCWSKWVSGCPDRCKWVLKSVPYLSKCVAHVFVGYKSKQNQNLHIIKLKHKFMLFLINPNRPLIWLFGHKLCDVGYLHQKIHSSSNQLNF